MNIPKKPVTFVAAFTVDASWIADGFTLTDERARNMLSHELRGAHNSEIAARVIFASESPRDIFVRYHGYTAGRADTKELTRAYMHEAPHQRSLERALVDAIVTLSEPRPTAERKAKAAQGLRDLLTLVAPLEVPTQDF